MKPRQKSSQARQVMPDFSSFGLGSDVVVPPEAAGTEIDVANDRDWLAAHPEAPYRLRPPSIREVVAMNLPSGTRVCTIRGPWGFQIRAILGPPAPAPAPK